MGSPVSAIVDLPTQNEDGPCVVPLSCCWIFSVIDFLPGLDARMWVSIKASMTAYLERGTLPMNGDALSGPDRQLGCGQSRSIDPETDCPRETLFTQQFGPDVVDWAFSQGSVTMRGISQLGI